MRIQIRIDGSEAKGGTPLLHHSEILADPLSPEARGVAELAGKRSKTEAEHEELARREWSAGMYYDEELGPVLPTWNLVRSIQDAARLSKQGKKVERGVFPEAEVVALQYDGPRDRDTMWKAREFAFRKGIVVSGRRVMRTRPIFREWAAEAVIVVDPFVLDFETFEMLANQAGRYIGICDWRSGRYGRYAASCELLTSQAEMMDELAVFTRLANDGAMETLRETVRKDEEAHQAKNNKPKVKR